MKVSISCYRVSRLWMIIYRKLFLTTVFVLIACTNNKEKIVPQQRTLTESVYSSIIIQPDSLYQVYAVVSGILEENLVEEGDAIFKNTSLIQVRNNTPKLNTENARLAL